MNISALIIAALLAGFAFGGVVEGGWPGSFGPQDSAAAPTGNGTPVADPQETGGGSPTGEPQH